MRKIMAIENLKTIGGNGLPVGFSVERSQEFDGDIVIREDGKLAGIGFNGDEVGAFKAVFRRTGIEIFNAWKNSQSVNLEGGE